MPNNLVFIGIGFLLPNRAHTNFKLRKCRLNIPLEVYVNSYIGLFGYSVSISTVTEVTFYSQVERPKIYERTRSIIRRS